MKDKNEWWRFVKFSAFIIVPMLYFIIRYHNQRNDVKNDYMVTQGRIIYYDNAQKNSVEGRGRIIRYSYEVAGVTYERKVQTDRQFPHCEISWDLCQLKRYWVIYSRTDPEQSLINLSVEIQNVDKPEFPKTADDFY